MACNCGNKSKSLTASSQSSRWALVRNDGSKQEFATKLEATAQNHREGGTGKVKRLP